MKKILILSGLLALMSACAGIRQMQTGIRGAIDNSVEQKFEWGEVYCGEGTVCSEIEVLRVDFENRNGGQVQVTLRNRTGVSLQVQIGLEILNAQGVMLDQSNFQSVGIPGAQDKVWSMPGIYQKGAKIRVILRRV